jgi:hypothetical protein
MGTPQDASRPRGPVQALRAVFTGIGRVVMAADRSGPAAESPRWRSLDYTGNVRLLSADDLDDGAADGTADGAVNGTADRAVNGTADGAPDGAVNGHPAAGPSGAELPLAGYDSLTLASIRARLRGLDAGQVRTLAVYEANHAERPEVLGMFERRIEKLEAGQ